MRPSWKHDLAQLQIKDKERNRKMPIEANGGIRMNLKIDLNDNALIAVIVIMLCLISMIVLVGA